MRMMLLAMGALCCACGEPMPRMTEAEKAAAHGVTITRLQISEQGLAAEAQSGAAAVALTLTPGETKWVELPLAFIMGMWKPGDESRPCGVRILDRDGQLLREDGMTVGVTESRTLEAFEADLKVAEGLAALLSQNQQAWSVYRWELRDVGRTAHDLQGLRGPAQ